MDEDGPGKPPQFTGYPRAVPGRRLARPVLPIVCLIAGIVLLLSVIRPDLGPIRIHGAQEQPLIILWHGYPNISARAKGDLIEVSMTTGNPTHAVTQCDLEDIRLDGLAATDESKVGLAPIPVGEMKSANRTFKLPAQRLYSKHKLTFRYAETFDTGYTIGPVTPAFDVQVDRIGSWADAVESR